MRFTTEFKTIKIDLQKYNKDFDQFMKGTTEEAARSWLRTVVNLVPVWSKASRATFTELANKVRFPISFAGATRREDRENVGAAHGSGGTEFKRLKSYYFYYETDLSWLVWNNFHHAVKGDGSGVFFELKAPGPYRFEEAGERDFRSFAEQVKLPNLLRYLKIERLK